jgi:23S rRNA (uracil1939-C5)-methyltransferase
MVILKPWSVLVMTRELTSELVIETLGSRGDGVARCDEGPVYIPFTLPGERVRVSLQGERGEVLEILEESEERCEPLCRHYGTCGGCSLQHLKSPAYLEWKRDQVRQAFLSRGLDVPVEPVSPAQTGTRRRAVLAARRTRKDVLLGFSKRLTHQIVDMQECPVLRDRIVEALPDLAEMLGALLTRKGEARVTILDTGNGLDVCIEGVREVSDPDHLMQMAELCERLDLARLTIEGEVLVTRRSPVLKFGGVYAVPSPGAFVQASYEAEEFLVGNVLAFCKDASHVADLFAGSGTFALPLALQSEVLAVEMDEEALGAIENAVRQAQGLKPVKTLCRDLFREPLGAKELEGFGAVVFDPPRAGARAQAMELANSTVPRIIAVSCNPATLARDIRILIDGGYRLSHVKPVDQFLFSEHIEVIAILEK